MIAINTKGAGGRDEIKDRSACDFGDLVCHGKSLGAAFYVGSPVNPRGRRVDSTWLTPEATRPI